LQGEWLRVSGALSPKRQKESAASAKVSLSHQKPSGQLPQRWVQ